MSKQTKLFGTSEEPKVLTSLELEKARILASQISDQIKPLCTRLELVGSIRRQKTLVGDIDFVVVATDSNWTKITSRFKKSNIICAGNQLTKINYPTGADLFQADFYRASANNFGIQHLIRTGSAEHNCFLASYALSSGFRLKYSEGLLKNEQIVACETEESIFKTLGLLFPKPEEREIIDGKPLWLKK
jgi:DNA polymerase/3'-5' exonuclease PolX